LAQFTHQQQVHAQQAARYIRGFKDGISSHDTKPMMSALLINNIKQLYSLNHTDSQVTDIDDDGDQTDSDNDTEHISLCVAIDNEGQLLTNNQFYDYYYRSASLASMNFYDFCRSVKLENKKYSPKNTADTHLGVLAHHELLQPHKLADTHCLVEFWNEERGDGDIEYVPRVIGCSIPRPNMGTPYFIFVLAHFKPFGILNPLLQQRQTFEEAFKLFKKSEHCKFVINNWDAINESEDARDAECLKKRAAMLTQSQALTKSIFLNDGELNVLDLSLNTPKNDRFDFAINQQLMLFGNQIG